MTEDSMLMAREIAAQCWCDPTTENRIYDSALAEVFAKWLAVWIDTAKMNLNGIEYYTGLLDQIAKVFGTESYISDDGSVQDTPLRAKMPSLVEELKNDNVKLNNRLLQIHTAAGEAIVGAPSPIDAFRMLKDRLAAAEAAARYCYGRMLEPSRMVAVKRFPWLEDEAAKAAGGGE